LAKKSIWRILSNS